PTRSTPGSPAARHRHICRRRRRSTRPRRRRGPPAHKLPWPNGSAPPARPDPHSRTRWPDGCGDSSPPGTGSRCARHREIDARARRCHGLAGRRDRRTGHRCCRVRDVPRRRIGPRRATGPHRERAAGRGTSRGSRRRSGAQPARRIPADGRRAAGQGGRTAGSLGDPRPVLPPPPAARHGLQPGRRLADRARRNRAAPGPPGRPHPAMDRHDLPLAGPVRPAPHLLVPYHRPPTSGRRSNLAV
ncbi:MAG: hypothetical protein QOI35_3785, partial [Cryptosporangiaceae bacterium]|nr:hypothetical protein [Cryptosporangiaceae bacterium]